MKDLCFLISLRRRKRARTKDGSVEYGEGD